MADKIDYRKDTKLGPYKAHMKQLEEDFSNYRPLMLELAETFMPRRGRYLLSPNSDTESRTDFAKRNNIINGTTEYVARIIASGLQSGATSPSYPWFELSLEDEDLAAWGPVDEWLFNVRNIMLNMFSRSNFYPSTFSQYMELPTFGVSCMMMEEDFISALRCRPYTIGEYYLAYDGNYRVNIMYRKMQMTTRMMIDNFPEELVSQSVRNAAASYQWETRFEVVHCVQPNPTFKFDREDVDGKRFESVYYQPDDNQDVFLKREGYRVKPFVAPRWDVVGIDVQGDGIGAMALGDGQMLQQEEAQKLKLLDKEADPPMNADVALKKYGGNILPGGMNYLDMSQGNPGFAPVYQVKPNYEAMAHEIQVVEERIKQFYHFDLFMAVLGSTDSRKTATEILRGYEEKLQMVGPVLNRIQDEMHNPIIQRAYDIGDEFKLFPEPPEELQGMSLKIEHVSDLARAQKRTGVESIERTHNYIERVVALQPNAAAKFNGFKAIDRYSHAVNIPPGIINDDDVAFGILNAQLEQQQQEQAKETVAGMAEGAEKLSKAKLDENSVLDKVVEAV